MYAGVDIGSVTTKAVIIDKDDRIAVFSSIPTATDRDRCGEEVLGLALAEIGMEKEDLHYIVSTGYGRRSFLSSHKVLPEIYRQEDKKHPCYRPIDKVCQ